MSLSIGTPSSISSTGSNVSGKFLSTGTAEGVFIDIKPGSIGNHAGVAFFVDRPTGNGADINNQPPVTDNVNGAWNQTAFGVIFLSANTIRWERWFHDPSNANNNGYAGSYTGSNPLGYNWVAGTTYRVTGTYAAGKSIIAVYDLDANGNVVSKKFEKTLTSSAMDGATPLSTKGQYACAFTFADSSEIATPVALYA